MKQISRFSIIILSLSLILIVGCKKESTPEPSPTPTPTTNALSAFYFTAKIDGSTILLEDGKNNYSNLAGGYGMTIPYGWQSAPFSSLIETNDFINNTNNFPSYGIAFVKNYIGDPNDLTIYKNIISVQSFNYGNLSPNTGVNGIDGAVVFFYDTNGIEWSTGLGSADQTGSTFNVTEYIDDVNGIFHKVIKATFSCKLYDGSGNSKTLTDGTFRGRIITW